MHQWQARVVAGRESKVEEFLYPTRTYRSYGLA